MPRRFALFIVAMIAGLALVVAMPGTGPVTPARATACSFDGIVLRASDFEPIAGVTLLVVGGGQSATTNSSGEFSLDAAPSNRMTVRVVAPTDIIVVTQSHYFVVIEGSADVTLSVSFGCAQTIIDVRAQARVEGPVTRPSAPSLPDGFTPAQATLDATVPMTSMGNASNVPWTGLFWLTAPVVTVGVCDIFDGNTTTAVESAINRWETAPSLGWKIVRNNDACKSDFPQPKLLIKREQASPLRNVLGSTSSTDMQGNRCDFSSTGSVCWVGTVTIKLNPPGFDRLSATQQVATVLHEMGHGIGLGHTRGCGDSIMWFNTRCDFAPTLNPGNDDIASADDLLSETLRRLRPAPAMPPATP